MFKNRPLKNLLTIGMILIGGSVIYFSFANKVMMQNFSINIKNGDDMINLPGVRIELSNSVNNYSLLTNASGYYSSWIAPGKYRIKISKTGFIETTDSITLIYKLMLEVKMYPKLKATIINTLTRVKKDSASIILIEDSMDKMIEPTISRDRLKYDKSRSLGYKDESDYSVPATTYDKVAPPTPGGAKYYKTTSTSSRTDMPAKRKISESAVMKSVDVDFDITYDDNKIVKAGLLTAGEVNDFSKWNMWNDIAEGDLKIHSSVWKMQPKFRYTVQVTNSNSFPVINATVKLIDKKGNIIWTAMSDQTGKAELWAELYNAQQSQNASYDASIIIQDKVIKINNLKPFKQGINFIKVTEGCSKADTVDIAWVVDATGSMGDEIAFLKTELNDVMLKAKEKHPDLNFRLGSVFYRDFGDAYLTQTSQLSSDINQTVNFIKNQNAGGGGDFPEAVDTALSTAMNKLNWSKNARTKLLFLVLDAPPHTNPADIDRVKKAIEKAAKLGIHIIPVASSGVDKSTEYLMRCLALTTNGTYVFLTDDSGIGGSHIKPTTDEYKVETLNGLLLRLIDQYTLMVSCTKQLPDTFKQILKDTMQVVNRFNIKDTAKFDSTQLTQTKKDSIVEPHLKFANWKYYPNPTTGPLTVEIEGQINELFLTDFGGKILMRFQPGNERIFNINLEQYPSGVYLLRYYYGDKLLDGKVVVMH